MLALMAPGLIAGEDKTETAVRAVLQKQVEDWNRGDISAFVLGYAENCTFLGTGVTEGRAGVEQRYRLTYPTSDAMGHLAFSDLKVKKIGGRMAVVTGAYRLQRPSAPGGDKKGVFSLLFKRQGGVWLKGGVWRIVLDHTS